VASWIFPPEPAATLRKFFDTSTLFDCNELQHPRRRCVKISEMESRVVGPGFPRCPRQLPAKICQIMCYLDSSNWHEACPASLQALDRRPLAAGQDDLGGRRVARETSSRGRGGRKVGIRVRPRLSWFLSRRAEFERARRLTPPRFRAEPGGRSPVGLRRGSGWDQTLGFIPLRRRLRCFGMRPSLR
jgi:hypothetical protein